MKKKTTKTITKSASAAWILATNRINNVEKNEQLLQEQRPRKQKRQATND